MITRLLTLMGFGGSAFVFMACYGPRPDDYHLVALPENLELPADAQSEEISIQTRGRWTVKKSPSFVSLPKDSGEGDDNIRIKVSSNDTGETRTGMIIIEGEENADTIFVAQNGKQ